MKDISRLKRNEFIKEILDKKRVSKKQIMDIFGLSRYGLYLILNPKKTARLDKSHRPAIIKQDK